MSTLYCAPNQRVGEKAVCGDICSSASSERSSSGLACAAVGGVLAAREQARRSHARILLLGCGTVGTAVAERLLDIGDSLGVQLTRVLVRDLARPRIVPTSLLTTSFDEALAEQPDLVIELLGGTEPAFHYVTAALERGIPVVTANKTLVARDGAALEAAARRGNTRLVHEAAVGAAIPVFAALRHLEGDRVRRISGIVNGSCNFILSHMSRGKSYADALREAAANGLVEPDPSADVSGRDSAEKLVLLARACCPTIADEFLPIDITDIDTNGITPITPDDIVAARRSGHVIKLIAEYDPSRGVARVGPTLIPKDHPLASVNDEENAIVIETELAGEIILRGKGAGPRPTASAVLGDVVRLLAEPRPIKRIEPLRPTTPLVSDHAQQGPPLAHRHRTAPRHPHALFSVRVDRPKIGPSDLLDHLAASSLAPTEVSVSRTGARLLVRAECSRHITTALAAIANPPIELVVMPIWTASRPIHKPP